MSKREELLKIISEMTDEKIVKVIKLIEQMIDFEEEYDFVSSDLAYKEGKGIME